MESIYKILLISALFLAFACKDEEENTGDKIFQVEVLGKGMDCGDLFLIRFEAGVEQNVYKYSEQTNAYYPVFYAVGLPEELKQEGLFLDITLRECGTDDIPMCTAWGPGYSIVCIESAEPVSLVDRFP